MLAKKAPNISRSSIDIHRVSKNVPPLACYNSDTREQIFDIFSTNSTHKVRNQKTLYYASSNNLCFCITWQKGNIKMAFFPRCISALSEFNQLLLDFFSLSDSRLIFTLLYDSLNLVINAFSLGLLGGMVQEKGSR